MNVSWMTRPPLPVIPPPAVTANAGTERRSMLPRAAAAGALVLTSACRPSREPAPIQELHGDGGVPPEALADPACTCVEIGVALSVNLPLMILLGRRLLFRRAQTAKMKDSKNILARIDSWANLLRVGLTGFWLFQAPARPSPVCYLAEAILIGGLVASLALRARLKNPRNFSRGCR